MTDKNDDVTMRHIERVLARDAPCKAFTPYVFWGKEGDSLTIYFDGAADYSEQVTEQISVYRSIGTGAIVGCRIDGLSRITNPEQPEDAT